MAPCKVKPDLATGAPLALSYPHFYMVGSQSCANKSRPLSKYPPLDSKRELIMLFPILQFFWPGGSMVLEQRRGLEAREGETRVLCGHRPQVRLPTGHQAQVPAKCHH